MSNYINQVSNSLKNHISELANIPCLFLRNPNVCIFRKNRALAPHERSAVPLGTDHCPVG